MKLVFLEASVPLTKRFELSKGTISKTPYPFVWEFTSHIEDAKDPLTFSILLSTHAKKGHCLLKGLVKKPLVKESRAGSTDTNSPTEYLVLDIDGLPEFMPDSQVKITIDSFLAAIGIRDTTYIVQWSASYGIENKKLRAHVIIMLSSPMTPPLLKQWLIHLNHSVPLLRENLSLTKTAMSLSWTLDISACQNDKLIYIAPPVLKGIKDPVPAGQRIQLVKHKRDFLTIPNSGAFSSEKNRELTNVRIAELREADGLPKRKFVSKMHGSTEVLVKPDASVITEMKQERGFVYFNLNGGDSWAYYHPENNPDYILNFKGEPAYLTKELLPDYWSQLTNQSVRVGSNGITYLAFCDRSTSTYWRGTYDAAADELDLYQAKNETQLRHFALQYGMPLGDFIPEWDLTFDPHDNVRIDFATKTVNTFSPSPYMKAIAKPTSVVPKTINRVITHALGGDQAIVDHFYNWVAFILQERDRTTTAWVLHGTQGTGKGILMNNILRPIFGKAHTASRRMEELSEPYNHFMKNALLVFVDEVQTSTMQNEGGVMAKLRGFITEPIVAIRAMYANAPECRNYTNWLLTSNKSDPVSIPKDDRRHNVAKYQPNKLVITDKDFIQIEKELQAFHDYLLYYPLDKEKARSVIQTADRDTMISISESSIDTVADKMLEGSFEFFVDQLPAGTQYPGSNFEAREKLDNYKLTLLNLIARTDPATGKCSVAREELRVLFDFVIGKIPTTPNKFTSLLKHHRIHIEKVWLDGKTVSGIKTTWQDLAAFTQYEAAIRPPQPAPAPAPVSTKGQVKVLAPLQAKPSTPAKVVH